MKRFRYDDYSIKIIKEVSRFDCLVVTYSQLKGNDSFFMNQCFNTLLNLCKGVFHRKLPIG